MIDNKEIERILEILENLDDEKLAVQLLQEFNRASSELGQLLLNQDPSLGSVEWKKRCDQAQKKLDDIVKQIEQC
ncbi:MAG: hypothetical protein ACXVLQ_01540 [Bacteriovorax sp.]